MGNACESLFLLNADDIARQRSRAREEYNALIQLVSDQAAVIEGRTAEITSLSLENNLNYVTYSNFAHRF